MLNSNKEFFIVSFRCGTPPGKPRCLATGLFRQQDYGSGLMGGDRETDIGKTVTGAVGEAFGGSVNDTVDTVGW